MDKGSGASLDRPSALTKGCFTPRLLPERGTCPGRCSSALHAAGGPGAAQSSTLSLSIGHWRMQPLLKFFLYSTDLIERKEGKKKNVDLLPLFT